MRRSKRRHLTLPHAWGRELISPKWGWLFFSQQSDNLRCEVLGHLLDFGDSAGSQWTGKHHYAGARHTQSRRPGMGGPDERAGDDANRWHAFGLCDYRVVETPRCAGASIGDGVYYHIAFV